MVNKTTVYVVGAGASFEMGLPVGETLKQKISDLLAARSGDTYQQHKVSDDLINSALRRANELDDPALKINKTILAAAHTSYALPLSLSIDNYLHTHNGDKATELCGKLAIVRAILMAEAKSTLSTESELILMQFKNCAKAWLVPFMQLLSEDCNLERLRERLRSVVFIVFNYDRCIEHFLMNAIKAVYRVDANTAAEIVSEIEIYHPYGTVGRLPWNKRQADNAAAIQFGGIPQAEELLNLTKGIKTFTEGTDDDSSDIIAIRRNMQEADRIVFLGFAYHRLNMQLLLGDVPTSRMTKRAFGTAYGMSNSDTQLVNESLGHRLNAPSIAIKNELTCFNLFHEFSRTLNFVGA